jgi:hypothetical protein
MNKNKKKFSCPYCDFEFLRGSRGYANHLKAKHAAEHEWGETWYSHLSAAERPFVEMHPKLKDKAPRTTTQLTGLDECHDQFNQEALQVRDDILVNHPPHYGGGNDPYEAIKVIHAWNLGFDLGNVLKYIRRADCKGTPIQDLEKAKFYLEDEIRRRKEVASFDAQT